MRYVVFVLTLLVAQKPDARWIDRGPRMAVHVWTSGSTGNIGTPANWTTDGTTPGTPPAVAATGWVDCVSVLAADTVTVNGLVYTAVSGAKMDNTEFRMDSGGDNGTATDLADSITADSRGGTIQDVTAAATSNRADITATPPGNYNPTLASSNGTRLPVSGATMTGGDSWETTDIVIVRGSASIVAMTTGLDTSTYVDSGNQPLAPALMLWQDDYTADIGANGNMLTIGAAKVVYEGLGHLWLKGTTGKPIVDCVIDSRNYVKAATLSGSIDRIGVFDGTVEFQTGGLATFNQLDIGPKSTAKVIGNAAGAAVTLTMAGGELTTDTVYAFVMLAGGTLTSTGVITELVQTGGLFVYEPINTVVAPYGITKVRHVGGVADYTGVGVELTLGDVSGSGWYRVFDSARVIGVKNNDLITLVNEIDMRRGD